MSTRIKPAWLRMSYRKLHPILHKEYPTEMANSLLDEVMQIKKARRSSAQKVRINRRLWDGLLAPLREELATVQTLKYQAGKAEHDKELKEKLAVYTDYEVALLKLREWLHKTMMDGFTPVQLVTELKRQGKLHDDVRGDHWTDFIPERTKLALKRRYADVMNSRTVHSGRRKELFYRNLTRQEWTAKRDALFRQIDAERQLIEVGMASAQTDEQREQWNEKLLHVEAANFKLTNIKQQCYLPAKWASLIEADPSLLAQRTVHLPARIRKEMEHREALANQPADLSDEAYLARVLG